VSKDQIQPGRNAVRLISLMREAVRRCCMNLSGLQVLTEAASGSYVVTPLLAAMAGARRVFAVTKTTRHGTRDQIRQTTMALARRADVQDRIEIINETTAEIIQQVDIITNSGHVRPIDARMVALMKPTAVISLMYEAWEFRESDVDLETCRRQGITVAGTNERHPNIDVFSYLGIMAVKLLLDAGVAVYRSRILVICDNPFAPHIVRGLTGAGAEVDLIEHLGEIDQTRIEGTLDALLLATHPGRNPPLGLRQARQLADRWPGAVLAQFWGDVEREELAVAGIPCWPGIPPHAGHMGILPSDIGPEPIIRLQAGGLKVGGVLIESVRSNIREDWEYVDEFKTT
jgi:hypothetical protein